MFTFFLKAVVRGDAPWQFFDTCYVHNCCERLYFVYKVNINNNNHHHRELGRTSQRSRRYTLSLLIGTKIESHCLFPGWTKKDNTVNTGLDFKLSGTVPSFSFSTGLDWTGLWQARLWTTAST